MSIMKISATQAERLLAARGSYDRKAKKKAIFAEIRAQHGIPKSTKFKVAVEDPSNPDYLVIRGKYNGIPLDNGLTPTAPVVPTIAASPAAPAKKVPVKKAPPKAAPVKKTAAAKKAPAKKTDVSYPREVRLTVAGKRVRLGTAKDAAHEKRLVTAYKKKNGVA